MSPRVLRTASRYQLAAVAVVGAVTLALWPPVASGVMAGGLLMAANFWFLQTLASRVFVGPAGSAKLVYGLLLAVKFALALAAIAILVLVLEVDAAGLGLGMSTLFVGVGAATIQQALGRSSQPDTASTASTASSDAT